MQSIQQYRPLKPSVQKAISENKSLVRALKKKGMGIDEIAQHLIDQVKCNKAYFDQETKGTKDVPDNANRNRALEMVVRIGDFLPSTKHEIEENRNINITITTEAADKAVKAANMEVIDCDEWEESEFLK